ncbi:MAG TPA: chemotaxis protein CheB [Solirubrobacteraceae bacterium]
MTDSPSTTRVIAIVASAGGLKAVVTVLELLPEDFEPVIVVLVHQDPERASRLVEILTRHSRLPVVAAEHDALLEPGTVVVAQPGRHVLITAGPRIATIASGASPPNRPSADLLLTTLAIACGSRATAVVLSGGGHDGATGATAVHDFGGTVVASDEATSTHFGMPQATIQRDDVVDHVVALDDIAGLLEPIISVARTPPDD